MPTLLRLPEVLRRTGLSRSTVYDLISKGKFPAAIPLASPRNVAWTSTDVDRWIEEQIASAHARRASKRRSA